jgi:hypothetical protein
MIQPRNRQSWGPSHRSSGGQHLYAEEPWKAYRPGRGPRMGHTRSGVPQEPGRHCLLRTGRKVGTACKGNPGPRAQRPAPEGSETRGRRCGTEREQNEQSGRMAVVTAPHSTVEAGEPAPGDPVEGRGCREASARMCPGGFTEPKGGKDGRYIGI